MKTRIFCSTTRPEILIKTCGRTASTSMKQYLSRCYGTPIRRSHWGPAATKLYRGPGDEHNWSEIEKVVTIVRDPVDRFISERVFRPNKRLSDYTKSEDHMGLLICEWRTDVYGVPFEEPFTAIGMLGIVKWECLLDAIEPLCKWLGVDQVGDFPHKLPSERGDMQAEIARWLTAEDVERMRSTRFAKHFGYG